MRFSWIIALIVTAGTSGIIIPEALAAGRGFFEAAPRLENVRTTFNDTQVRGATYYFTVTIPEDAVESLNELIIEQRGGFSDITFLLDETTAFIGTSRDRQDKIPLANVSQSEDKREITAQFEEPVEPGTTVTLGLRPRRNPRTGGVYLFGVTASPTTNSDHDFYMGVGRLQFYERQQRRPFRTFR